MKMGIWPWKKKAPQDRWEILNGEITYMRQIIGGYPPNCPDLDEVKGRWERAFMIADEHMDETEASIDARWAFGELLRMGHESTGWPFVSLR